LDGLGEDDGQESSWQVGFKYLNASNLAMLEKQGWIFLTEPNTLASHIFKSKYFPQVELMDVVVRNNSSFVWHNIWSSQVLRKEFDGGLERVHELIYGHNLG